MHVPGKNILGPAAKACRSEKQNSFMVTEWFSFTRRSTIKVWLSCLQLEKKEHFLTYFSIVLRKIHKQRKELNILCKLLKTAWTSLLQLQVKTQPGSEFCIAHHVFWGVPIQVPRCSFIAFRAAHQFCTCKGHQL